jgi:hypothetical protein
MIDQSDNDINKRTVSEIKRLIKVLKTRKHVCQVNGIFGEAMEISTKIINLAQQAKLKKIVEEEEKFIASMQATGVKLPPVKKETVNQVSRVNFLANEIKPKSSPSKQVPIPGKRPLRHQNPGGPKGINTLIKEVRKKQVPKQAMPQKPIKVQVKRNLKTRATPPRQSSVQKPITSESNTEKVKEIKAKFKQKEAKLMLLLDRLKKDEENFEKEKVRLQSLLEEEWKTLEAERAQLVGEIEKERKFLDAEKVQLQKEREALERDDANLGAAITQFEQDKEEYKGGETQLNEERIKLEEKNAEVEKLRALLLGERERIQKKKTQLKKEKKRLKESRKLMEDNRLKFDNLKGVDAKLEMEIAFIEEEKAALSLEKAKLEKEKIKLKLEKKKFKKEKEKLKNA